MASQMADAKLLVTSVDIESGKYNFHATGTEVLFPGFLKLQLEEPKPAPKKKTAKAVHDEKEKPEGEEKEEAKFLPPLEVGKWWT